MVATKTRPASCVECVTCGASHPDLEIENRVQAARVRKGALMDAGGCGRTIVWTAAYRCVDCGRWFHHDCLREHFEIAAYHDHPLTSTLAGIGTAVTDTFVRPPVRVLTYPVDVGAQVVAATFLLALRVGRSLIGGS